MTTIRIHQTAGTLLLLIGAAHTVLTACIYAALSDEALWFAGSGLAMILLALVNLLARRCGLDDPVVRWVCWATNATFVAFGIAAVRVVPEPQAYAALVFIVLQAVAALALPRRAR